jgi:hypothetical protein
MKSWNVLFAVVATGTLLVAGDALSVPRPIGGSELKLVKLKMTTDAVAEVPRGGEGGGTATIPNEVFNLVKSIVGAGVLSLPAGAYFDALTVIRIFAAG